MDILWILFSQEAGQTWVKLAIQNLFTSVGKGCQKRNVGEGSCREVLEKVVVEKCRRRALDMLIVEKYWRRVLQRSVEEDCFEDWRRVLQISVREG